MNISQLPDDVWVAVADGKVQINCEFLALSFFITNLRNRRRAQSLSATQIVLEFKAFFNKHGQLPAAQRDFARIAQSRGYHV